MRIGIFDSGQGGLLIAQSIRKFLPQFDYVTLSDTLNVPYGEKTSETVHQLTHDAIDFLFRDQNCQIIIMACNTACACALRHLQQNYLRRTYPDRRVLGVVVPTIETALEKQNKEIGLIATERLVESQIYDQEMLKIDPEIRLTSLACPELVPLIEQDRLQDCSIFLKRYIERFAERNVKNIILGCTHYVSIKDYMRKICDTHNIGIISQDEVIPDKFENYLERHPETTLRLTRGGSIRFFVTGAPEEYRRTIQNLFPLEKVEIQSVSIEPIKLSA